MPASVINLEFRNHNSQRNYPLADDASCVDESGSFTLPADFLTGLDMPVHAGLDVDPARFFIWHISANSGGYGITVGYKPLSGDPIAVATAMVPSAAHTRDKSYRLGGIEPFADTQGNVVIGKLDTIADQPPGFWTFTFDAGRLDTDAIRPIIRGVSSIIVVNGTERSEPLQGDVELVAGSNIQLVPVIVSDENPQIVINAIEGEGLIDECVCAGDAAPTTPIKTINGRSPTATGDWLMIAGTCIEIVPITNGVRINNTCAKPCCGCTELEAITRDLERFGTEVEAAKEFNSRLAAAVDTMSQTVLGARMGDTSCVG